MGADFGKQRRDRIAKLLDKALGSEHLSTRPGAGARQLTYLEGWMVIRLANAIFGFDGWSSEVKEMKQDYCEGTGDRINVGFSCVCRVTLKDGTYREDVGFGNSENMAKGAGIEKAKKAALTDALKRALRQFGSALGNCCYDKDHTRNILRQGVAKRTVAFEVDLLKESELVESKSEVPPSLSFSQECQISDS